MAKTKLFLSVRVTENFFSPEEIKAIKQELEHHSKSEFIRKAIKVYLKNEQDMSVSTNQSATETTPLKLKEVKSLIKKNYSLLQELKQNQLLTETNQSNSYDTNYTKEQQEEEIEKAIDLIEEF